MGKETTEGEQTTLELEKRIKLAQKIAELEKDALKQNQKTTEWLRLKLQLRQKLATTFDEEVAILLEIEKTEERMAKLGESIVDGKQAAADATDHVEAATKSLLKKTLLVNDAWKGGIVGSIISSKEPLKDMAKALKKNLTLTNLMGTAFQNMLEASIEVYKNSDSASAAINKFTAEGKSYKGMVAGMYTANMQFGISADDVQDSYIGLYGEFTKFSSLGEKQKRRLTLHAAKLSRLGVSAGTTAANFETLVTSFGMSDKAAETVQRDMVDLAGAIGLPAEQMMENFQSSMPILSKWGKSAPKIFKKVAIHAKKLGVEMGTLLSLGDQFDTFEGAASAVGKLNAMVGGDVLNAYDMMNMSLEDRNMAVKRAVELDGESWGSMNRMKQMAYANAAGITDMEQAHRLFGGASADSLTAEEKRVDSQMKSQKSLEKALLSTTTIMDRIQAAITKIFDSPGMRDMLKNLERVLNYIVKHSDTIGEAVPWLIGGAGLGKVGGSLLGGSLQMGMMYKMMSKGPQMHGPMPNPAAGGLMKGLPKGALGKIAGRGVPILGSLFSAKSAYDSHQEGDTTGAWMSGISSALMGASAVAAMTGVGAPLAVGLGLAGGALEGANMLRKAYSPQKAKAAGTATKSSQGSQTAASAEASLVRAFTTAINSAQGHDVVLKIDGDEIGRFTEAYIGKKYKIS